LTGIASNSHFTLARKGIEATLQTRRGFETTDRIKLECELG
jgi:hypothetical protein